MPVAPMASRRSASWTTASSGKKARAEAKPAVLVVSAVYDMNGVMAPTFAAIAAGQPIRRRWPSTEGGGGAEGSRLGSMLEGIGRR